MSSFESKLNSNNPEIKPDEVQGEESLKQSSEQPALSLEEQLHNIEDEMKTCQQEIARLSKSFEETKKTLSETRKALGIEDDEESVISTFSETDELESLKDNLEVLKKRKEKLISQQTKELRDFLKQIDELDQSTAGRIHAKECYEKLLARENEFTGSEIEDEYWGAISFELFHMAQGEALSENIEQAKVYFSKALEDAKKGNDNDWRFYIEGTIYYFDNDQAALEKVIDKVNLNANVLQRLLAGLKQRGIPNYKEDY